MVDTDVLSPAQLRRQLEEGDIRCPAGRAVGDAGCYCAVEEGVLDGRTQTFSITGFCMSPDGYKECPSWVAEKDRIAAGQTAKLTDKPKVNKSSRQAKQDRLREAQELLISNTAEGRRFRRRLGLA